MCINGADEPAGDIMMLLLAAAHRDPRSHDLTSSDPTQTWRATWLSD